MAPRRNALLSARLGLAAGVSDLRAATLVAAGTFGDCRRALSGMPSLAPKLCDVDAARRAGRASGPRGRAFASFPFALPIGRFPRVWWTPRRYARSPRSRPKTMRRL